MTTPLGGAPDAKGDPTRMSYDLAVWEGARPADDDAAGAEFGRLVETYLEADEIEPPTPRMVVFGQTLLARFPDIDAPAGDDSPWSTAPLMNEVVGPLMYLAMVYSRFEEVSEWVAQVAAEQGLVCFDPQLEKLRP